MLNLNEKPLRKWTPNIDTIHYGDMLIRIMTYNILCDSLITVSTGIEEKECENNPILKWSDRKQRILCEILEFKSDIICIQEFERDEEFIKIMGQNNYDCSFKPRTGSHSEGCATFWNNKKFIVENLISLELNMNKKQEDISPIYDRDNVVLYCVLKYVLNCKICFIIANTHLLYNENRGDVKLGQIYQVLNGMNKLREIYKDSYEKVNLFLCGDMNSNPNSAIYKFITYGTVNCTNLERKNISGQNQGNLSNIDPKRLKGSLISYNTSKFKENSNKAINSFDNETWFNDILRIDINCDRSNMKLKYIDNYKFCSGEIKILSPLIMKSAYSECFNNVLQFLKKGKGHDRELPFDKITNLDEYDSIEINNIKMGFNNIDKTIDFVKSLTMEPPLTNYKDRVCANDYIFYNGNLKILRTYNIPDINRIIVDLGPMPNGIFPSDHIPLIADFYIE